MTQPSVPNLPSTPSSGEITNNSIELHWQELPEQDWNGSPITEYIVQVGSITIMNCRLIGMMDKVGNVCTVI